MNETTEQTFIFNIYFQVVNIYFLDLLFLFVAAALTGSGCFLATAGAAAAALIGPGCFLSTVVLAGSGCFLVGFPFGFSTSGAFSAAALAFLASTGLAFGLATSFFGLTSSCMSVGLSNLFLNVVVAFSVNKIALKNSKNKSIFTSLDKSKLNPASLSFSCVFFSLIEFLISIL